MTVLFGFKHSAMIDLPSWAGILQNQYMRLRLERRNKTKMRYWYRAIKREKLRLVELGISYELIDRICKYLVSLKQVNADRLSTFISDNLSPQASFDFNY